MKRSIATPALLSSIAATANPTPALSYGQANSKSIANTSISSTDQSAPKALTPGETTFTSDLVQMWAAELRLRHSEDELPDYLVKKLEALLGWSWHTETAAGMLAKWRIEADADFANKGRKRTYGYMELRVLNVLDLRDKWLKEAENNPEREAALGALWQSSSAAFNQAWCITPIAAANMRATITRTCSRPTESKSA